MLPSKLNLINSKIFNSTKTEREGKSNYQSRTPRATYNVHRLQQTEPTPTAKVSKISFFSSALIIREQEQ